jgi:hypothetical protein
MTRCYVGRVYAWLQVPPRVRPVPQDIGLPPPDGGNRRVLAALACLDGQRLTGQ